MVREKHVGAVLACLALSLTGGCGVKETTLHENLAPVARQTEELQADQEALQARLAASEEEMKRLRAELDALRPPSKNRKGASGPASASAGRAAAPAVVLPDGRPIPPPRVLSAAEAAREDAAVTAGTTTRPPSAPPSATATSPAAATAPTMPPHGPVPIASGTLPLVAPPPAGTPVPTPPPAPRTDSRAAREPRMNSEQSAYQQALSTYERKSFAEAEGLFDQFLQQWPNARLAPNALYWKAECLYSRGKFADSVFVFKDVVTRFPKHPKAADSLLKSAMAYKRLGDMDNANLHISVLAEDFPNSTALKRARELGFGR